MSSIMDDEETIPFIGIGTNGKQLSPTRQLQIMRAAQTQRQYRLKAADGRYLHFSGVGMTDQKAWAWIGTANKLSALRKAVKLPAGLKAVAVQ